MKSPRPFSWAVSAIGAGVVNALINGLFGWFLVKPGQVLPLFGLPSLAADTAAMAFGISFGTVLMVTPQARRELRTGKVSLPLLSQRLHDALSAWPRGTFVRSLQLGLLSVPLFAALPLLVLWSLSLDGAGRELATGYKAVFGFAQGALVTPFIAVAAMLGQPGLASPVAAEKPDAQNPLSRA